KNSSNRTRKTQTGSNDEDLTVNSASIQRLESHSDSELANTSSRQATKNKENAIQSLRAKTSQVHDSLHNDYYSSELDHVKEKLQFNIILIGSPRVGKSQLINAICN
ncbi:unnamed protein product, partial [Rotaria magnacalcarata]